MANILDLLKKNKQEQAEKKAANSLRTFKLVDGENIIRLLPAKDGDIPFRPYGQHFVKSEDGGKTSVYPCSYIITEGATECPICEAVFEGLAIHKGNKGMEDKISRLKASKRFLWNGIPDGKTDVEVIELSTTAFEGCRDRWIEHLEEEIGNPLDLKDGYPFKITRTGKGMDTEYDAVPSRKMRKELGGDILAQCVDLDAFIAQVDEAKLLTTLNKANAVMGLAAASSMAALGHSAEKAPKPEVQDKDLDLMEEELEQAMSQEYKPEPAASEPKAEESGELDDIDELLKGLED